MTTKYNKTELNPEKSFERHVFHRDQFAHYLRWSHVVKLATKLYGKTKKQARILDFGCGTSSSLAKVLYHNRIKCAKYLGLDIRRLDKASEYFAKVPWIKFEGEKDLIEGLDYSQDWDMIVSFEVLEHLGKHNTEKYLDNLKKHMSKDTILLLSTPCYDDKTGAAANHIIDGKIGEFEYIELQQILKNKFEIVSTYGTFASKKDYTQVMPKELEPVYEALSEYYDVDLTSVIMAPLFPMYSRNCLWKLKLKEE